jgi:hypothetical protein
MNSVVVPSSTLISYSRDKKGNPRGVLVAVKIGDRGDFNIGYAQCRKEDKFSKNVGLKIALGRANPVVTFSRLEEDGRRRCLKHMPHNLRKMLPSFIQRCEKYYKVSA